MFAIEDGKSFLIALTVRPTDGESLGDPERTCDFEEIRIMDDLLLGGLRVAEMGCQQVVRSSDSASYHPRRVRNADT